MGRKYKLSSSVKKSSTSAILPSIQESSMKSRSVVGSKKEEPTSPKSLSLPKTKPVRQFSSYRNQPDRWVPLFLDSLADDGLVTHACAVAGITKAVAFALKNQDEKFAEDWDAAIAASVDKLELEARSRALSYSDTLLIFLLKGNNPEKFADKVTLRTDQTIQNQIARMAEELGVSPEELVETVRQLSADTIEGEYAITEDTG